mmetsp:Transcript_12003/g.51528  ORF Transcript_12003/g.51528 Transcript_12003/m.51528 type:complete len:319 (+) Transcript_12003:1513-2469(+)
MGATCSAPSRFCTSRSQITTIFTQTVFMNETRRVHGSTPISHATCHARSGECASKKRRSGTTTTRSVADKRNASATSVTATYVDRRSSRQLSTPPILSRESAMGSRMEHSLRHGPASMRCTRPRLTVTLNSVAPVLLSVIRSVHVTCCSRRITISAGFADAISFANLFRLMRFRSHWMGSSSSAAEERSPAPLGEPPRRSEAPSARRTSARTALGDFPRVRSASSLASASICSKTLLRRTRCSFSHLCTRRRRISASETRSNPATAIASISEAAEEAASATSSSASVDPFLFPFFFFGRLRFSTTVPSRRPRTTRAPW